MDNFHIDITSDGPLGPPMKIAFGFYKKAEGYVITPEKGLVFFNYLDGAPKSLAIKLPFKLDAEGAADFARRWLEEQNYGPEPDHDGDNGKGWRLYNEEWGHVGGWTGSIVAVQPRWAMYGK